jgi:hypothetical protein
MSGYINTNTDTESSAQGEGEGSKKISNRRHGTRHGPPTQSGGPPDSIRVRRRSSESVQISRWSAALATRSVPDELFNGAECDRRNGVCLVNNNVE